MCIIVTSYESGGDEMVNFEVIEDYMVRQNITKNELAKILKISRKTLDKRFNQCILLAGECDILIKLFKLPNPAEIFFSNMLRNK